MAEVVKNLLPAMQSSQEMRVQSLGWEYPLEEEMNTTRQEYTEELYKKDLHD